LISECALLEDYNPAKLLIFRQPSQESDQFCLFPAALFSTPRSKGGAVLSEQGASAIYPSPLLLLFPHVIKLRLVSFREFIKPFGVLSNQSSLPSGMGWARCVS
jgi:hypothetical protein